MDKTEKLQMIDEGKMLEDAVEEFVQNELTPEKREEYYCKWLSQIAVSKRFGDEPNKSKVVACRCIERLRTEKQAVVFPEELNNDKAKAIFDKAIELGLMNENYKWNKGKTLCACFAFGMNIELDLGKGKRKSWKPFEILFGYDNLRGSINDIKFHSQDPSEIDLVSKVFPNINLYAKIMEFE